MLTYFLVALVLVSKTTCLGFENVFVDPFLQILLNWRSFVNGRRNALDLELCQS